MSITSAVWLHSVEQLQHTPDDTTDHRLGDVLAACTTDDEALRVLIAMVVDDPPCCREYRLAGRLLHDLTEEQPR